MLISYSFADWQNMHDHADRVELRNLDRDIVKVGHNYNVLQS